MKYAIRFSDGTEVGGYCHAWNAAASAVLIYRNPDATIRPLVNKVEGEGFAGRAIGRADEIYERRVKP